MSYDYISQQDAIRRAENARRNTRSIVVGLIIIVILIIIAVVVYLALRRRQNTASTTPTTSVNSSKCASNADCPSTAKVCQVDTGTCVQCSDNTTCSGNLPVCQTSTNSCVQCVVAADCPCGQCNSNNICAPYPAPTITNAFTLSNSGGIDFHILVSYPQPSAGVQVVAQILANTTVLYTSTPTLTASGGELIVNIKQTGINSSLTIFGGTTYNVQIKTVKGTCVSDYSAPYSVLTSFCIPGPVATSASANIFTVFVFTDFTITSLGLVASKTSNIHPNLAEYISTVPGVGGVLSGFPYNYFSWPNSKTPVSVASGETWYFRTYYYISNSCAGALSGQISAVLA